MSEDSKMGLFGSKDKNQEQREKSSKDNSPARYAPYCIDSDTETYDTEALSMMDINDIIGVQSGEQTSDSTLESEIAALSQIITESKVELTQQSMDPKLETQQESSKVSSSNSNTTCSINSANISSTLTTDQPISEKHVASSIFEQTKDETTVPAHENAMFEGSSPMVTENSSSNNMSIDSVKCENAIDMDTKEAVDNKLSSTDKPRIEIESSMDMFVDTAKETVQTNTITCMNYEKDVVKKEKSIDDDESKKQDEVLEYKNETKSVVTVGNISKSLQLIGEAYISEDSEETNMNDNEFPKEASSLSFSQETSFDIPAIRCDEKNSEISNASKENEERCFELSHADNTTITKESNIKLEDIVNRKRTEYLNTKVAQPENSSPNETLQENLSDLALNKTVCNSAISNTYEQMENKLETENVDKFEKISTEHPLSSEISVETEDTSSIISVTSVIQAAKRVEENQKAELDTVESKADVSALISEIEKQDNIMAFIENELPDTKEVNDNCLLTVDNTKEVLTEDASKCNNKNTTLSESETQNSILSESSNEKSSIVEAVCKNNFSQEANTAADSSHITDKTVSIADKINDDSLEIDATQINLETAAVTCGDQDNVNLAICTEKTSTLSDERTSAVIPSAANDKLNVNEDMTLQTPIIEEKETDRTRNIPSMTDTEEGTSTRTSESLDPIERDDSIVQLLTEKSEVDIINNTISNKSEEHLISVPDDKTHTAENINESLHEMEKIENLEIIQKTVFSPTNKESLTEEITQQTFERPELYTQTETIDFIAEQMKDKSTLGSVSSNALSNANLALIENSMVIKDESSSSLDSTIRKKDKIKESVIDECLPNEEIKKADIFTLNTNQDTIAENKEYTNKEEETLKKSPTLESEALKSDVQAINTQDENLQEEMHDETVSVIEKVESIDTNVTVIEEESAELIKKSTDINIKDIQSNVIGVSTLQKDSEKITDEQDENVNLTDDHGDSKSISDVVPDTMETFPEMQSSKDATDAVTIILNENDVMVDVKNILETEGNLEETETDPLQSTTDLRLEANIEKLAEKLSQDSVRMDDTIVAHNMDSLQGLLDLDLMSGNENTSLKNTKIEDKTSVEEIVSKDVDMDLLLDQTNQNDTVLTQNPDYITNVISSCLTSTDNEPIVEDSTNDRISENKTHESLKANEDGNTELSENIGNEKVEEPLRTDNNAEQNDLDVVFEDNQLGSVGDLEEVESKLELPQDILLEGVVSRENLTDMPSVIENSQSSSEISELESAVKFLQESEEQTIDSPLVLSPKMVESVVEDITKQADTELYAVPDESDNYTNAESELASHISISISEAEIISEAAKLENERKYAVQMQNVPDIDMAVKKIAEEAVDSSGKVKPNERTENQTCSKSSDFVSITSGSSSAQTAEGISEIKETIPDVKPLSREGILKTCELIPRTSILEERLKEPPKIEIPAPDSTKVLESSISPNDSLLIPKDARTMAYPTKMLESPKSGDRTSITESAKSVDTPRKDSEKHDFENVGSPRIILKIAKSAITDCSEPRSPKSPKIRSAANSPNPEDSPGQKLGKIKLKLSKGGHPSIISNENLEETSQWHTDNTSSLSPIGMKIKLSKSGDASIVGTATEKHENNSEDSKEVTKYKFEEPKRTDSPIGMKIKLSKSGDSASIVQQDKEILTKHKEKLEIPQGSPKRTESPIGMKIKLSKTGDASIIQSDWQESTEEHKEAMPKRTDSPIGMKIKLSKTGDASIVSPSDPIPEDTKDSALKTKEKQDYATELPKRTESPIGMKIKLSKGKGGAASIISVDNIEDTKEKLEVSESSKRTESPLGMKIKLSKSGDASIIHSEVVDDKEMRYREKLEVIAQDTIKSTESSGIKIKMLKSGDISMSKLSDTNEEQDTLQNSETSFVGIKTKMSKSGDSSVVIGASGSSKTEQTEDSKSREAQAEMPKRTESPIGMKIKLSKSGDASIVQSETTIVSSVVEDHQNKIVRTVDAEHVKSDLPSSSSLGMKIKLFKTGDASVVEAEGSRKDKQLKRNKDATESPLEMKIKLSKTGHPTIVACDSHDNQGSSTHKVGKESPSATPDSAHASFSHRYAEHHTAHIAHSKESSLKILKTTSGGASHPAILQSNRSELTIEPVTPLQIQNRKAMENAIEISAKRKDITISSLDSKKLKLEAQLSQILPEVTIQPVVCRDQQKQQQQQQQQLLFDPKTSLISRQQMSVISQEISITQVRPVKASQDISSVSDKLKDILSKKTTNSPGGSDCEIIEHRPELIIVNENSNSSQDVVIIEEVTPTRAPDIKVPKKRGRPRRNPLAQQHIQPPQMLMSRDPLSLDEVQVPQFEHRENERPKRTCRNQKSYAPPKRGRGRGRGKRKLDNSDIPMVGKKSRIDQDLSAIEASTMAVITIDEPSQQDSLRKSELYKALKQPPIDLKGMTSMGKIDKHSPLIGRKEMGKKDSKAAETSAIAMHLDSTRSSCGIMQDDMLRPSTSQAASTILDSKDGDQHKRSSMEIISEKTQKGMTKQHAENKSKTSSDGSRISEIKEIPIPPGHSNWLTPMSKKQADANIRGGETVSTVQVIDEETRMSAESCSRSQTPARNIPAPTSETTINEESQGSVLSTATTESEKVKVKNRRMEINFDPDEGPFTVDKIAEYEWPLDKKGETFMIQEQISQYLGVKSFKRKYPDLKRRMVDMEERNYLRENGLVSEAMCDMGLTAVSSSEVLDVMCSDFPDQYEEYRKHMREKQVKEHSKKQKELTAAANAERNRIDLAEMAVQSALSWNISLNKARRENRKCCLDLQTFTIHVPKKQQKVDTEHKASHYPVALIPGQYTDYYREYTSAELRYYPLNTVLYGPTRPNERKFDSQSEASQSDSDSESSSDDSSSSSSEGTQDTEGSQSTMDDVDMEIVTQKDDIKLKCKMCLKVLNKHNKSEILIQCGTCNGNVHPSCIDLTLDMVPHIQSYAWQCTDCKTCAQCHDPADEDKMLFCDMCDRGYHIYCVGLRRVPQGRWHCQECAVCANCGSREPGGANSDRNSVAQWQHEYKKGEKNTRVYVSTLCVQCSKLWRKGRYCPHCSRCHTAQRLDLEANLVHCSACDKYLHLDCVETKGIAVDKKNYLCDFCTPSNRQQVIKPLMSKMLKT